MQFPVMLGRPVAGFSGCGGGIVPLSSSMPLAMCASSVGVLAACFSALGAHVLRTVH